MIKRLMIAIGFALGATIGTLLGFAMLIVVGGLAL